MSPTRPGVAVAWIGALAMVVAASIAGGVKLWTTDKKPTTETVQSVANVQSQQAQTVTNTPGATNIQAGRDVVVQSTPPIGRAPIRQIVVEARFTTDPKKGIALPPAEVPTMGSFGGHAALDGPAGRVRLDLIPLTRYRAQEDGTLVVINRFVLPAASDLHERPVEVLGNYRTLDVPLAAPDFEAGIGSIRVIEVSMVVNGEPLWHASVISKAAFVKGQRFEVPLGNLSERLARRGQ